MLSIWWAWLVAGFALLALTALMPEPILLGFAVGAALIGVILLLSGPFGGALAASLPLTLLTFAVLSFVAWFILRRWMGIRRGQVKIWKRDINED